MQMMSHRLIQLSEYVLISTLNNLSNINLAVRTNNSSLKKDITSESLSTALRQFNWFEAFHT